MQARDYTLHNGRPKTPHPSHEQLLSRISNELQGGFTIKGVLDAANCEDLLDEQAILFSMVSELLIPADMVRALRSAEAFLLTVCWDCHCSASATSRQEKQNTSRDP
jgi:hypothetical protein